MDETPEDDSRTNRPKRFAELPELMTRKELGEFLRVSVSSLKRWAEEGVGPQPVYLRPRAPRYEKAAVEKYLAALKRGPENEDAPAKSDTAATPAAPAAAAAPVAPTRPTAPAAPADPAARPAPAVAPARAAPVAAPTSGAPTPTRVLSPAEKEARLAVQRAAAAEATRRGYGGSSTERLRADIARRLAEDAALPE